MLEQQQTDRWVPIAFFSKSLQKTETRYSAFDRERVTGTLPGHQAPPLLLRRSYHDYLQIHLLARSHFNGRPCSRALLSGKLSCFGLPKDITSERKTVCHWPLVTLLDMTGAHTTAYHAQANDIVEHFYPQKKASLKAKQNTTKWFNELLLVL